RSLPGTKPSLVPPTIMTRRVVLSLALGWIACTGWSVAQEVAVPDPALNASIREALNKPLGPLTSQDLLGLTNFSAISRGITNLQGLAGARNLKRLLLDDNRITDLSVPNVLANMSDLEFLDLNENRVKDLAVPPGLTNLNVLRLEFNALTNLTLSAGLTGLTELYAGFNQLTALDLPSDLTHLS